MADVGGAGMNDGRQLVVEADAGAELYGADGVRLGGVVSTDLLASLLAPLYDRIDELEAAVFEDEDEEV